MRQRTRFAFVTFALALASAFGAVKAASAMGALPDHRLTAITVGTYPDCVPVPNKTCNDSPAEYCWLDDSNPNDKRCMESCHHDLYTCEDNCPPGHCDEVPEDCEPCRMIVDLGALPESGSCQALCAAHPCNVFKNYGQCGSSSTWCNTVTIYY
ncbi:MAG: hypothetical protein GW892_20590 [Armatimonadetes bacterium]|nr:hypothetical protein [Armatimonadota bacterium]NCP34638.1 hypothetical protein [Armatimonadota bacterium]NCQ32449.1 hypothetical protein [Armatimonadota bacterium]PIU94973.1 MAG: hypothetical protein COS65_04830 [Armatimonadetes bacterium CG06_land_8_20_14_3_00_66_21]PIX42791.1 MAG: hypothetical protein COZ57_20670 [Armatimonadetes bacterium CG_4_8_14_3_um_filter_66_20]